MKLGKDFYVKALIGLVVLVIGIIAASLITNEIYARKLAKATGGSTTSNTPVATNEMNSDGSSMRTLKVM